jgi:hypothetical protein
MSATGFTRNFIGRGEMIEFTAVEEDSGAVVEGVLTRLLLLRFFSAEFLGWASSAGFRF